MKELTREQKKIIYITAIICSSLLAFVIFVYLPQSRRLSVIRQQLKEAEANIADIGYITSGRDLNEAVKDLSAKLNLATKIIPSDKNDVIFNLTEAAKKIRLQVNSIDPQGEV
jgi:type II secretory pathway component PulM